jgi:uncharacterized phiE125 gp8 family phage protein
MALRAPVALHQFRANVQTTAPAVEPVTAAELRTFLRETATGLPDAEANAFIAEAREYIEEMSGLALITQTWLVALDSWPAGKSEWWDGVRQGSIVELYGPSSYSDIALPRYPLQSIAGVNVYDEDGNATAVTVASVFDVDTYSAPGRIALKRGATWPVALRAINAIEITYVAGYGDAASDVPATLRGAVKKMAGSLYAHRGDGCDVADAYSMSGAAGMVGAYRVKRV